MSRLLCLVYCVVAVVVDAIIAVFAFVVVRVFAVGDAVLSDDVYVSLVASLF